MSPKEDTPSRDSFATSTPEFWFELGLERLRALRREDPAKALSIAQAVIERIYEIIEV
jgi:hypothetical protein